MAPYCTAYTGIVWQFFAPRSNKRQDQSGGSLDNYLRPLLEVATAVKARIGQGFRLAAKINSVEFQSCGFSAEDALQAGEAIENAGFDYVEVAGGMYEYIGFAYRRERTRKREGYFVEFAKKITKALKTTKVYTTGGFQTLDGMVCAVDSVEGI